MVKKAGTASSKLLKSTCVIVCIMSIPTTMSAGAVACPGMTPTNPEKNIVSAVSTATVTAVRPVRPPCVIPDADSI